MKFGKYNFINQNKLRRAQAKAGKGANVDAIAREYLIMAGLLTDLKGKVIKSLDKKKGEDEGEKTLDQMTGKELKLIAKDKGIDLKGIRKNDDIVKAIEEFDKKNTE